MVELFFLMLYAGILLGLIGLCGIVVEACCKALSDGNKK